MSQRNRTLLRQRPMTEAPQAKSNEPECAEPTPIGTDLGVNPDWREETDRRPPIPLFDGKAEIGRIALVFTLWARVEGFLYDECGVLPLRNRREEKKHLSILLESETSIVCLLCLLNDEHYSAGALVDAMVGEHATLDERGNARKRLINRTLPIVAERYGLLKYTEKMIGKSREYSICRSPRLTRFAREHLINGFNAIIAASGPAQSTRENDPVQECEHEV